MGAHVCIDASLALILLIPHQLSSKAEALWRSWLDSEILIVAPPLFFAEVTSVLRESVYFGRILPGEGEDAFNIFMRLGVRSSEPVNLQSQAWDLARQYNRPRAYDAQYLAVAKQLGCELWTADRRLVNAVPVSWLRWVGDYTEKAAAD